MAKKKHSELDMTIHQQLLQDGWVKPFLCDDGRVWIYAGYGQWDLLDQHDPRAVRKLGVYQHPMCAALAVGNARMLEDRLAAEEIRARRVREAQQQWNTLVNEVDEHVLGALEMVAGLVA